MNILPIQTLCLIYINNSLFKSIQAWLTVSTSCVKLTVTKSEYFIELLESTIDSWFDCLQLDSENV